MTYQEAIHVLMLSPIYFKLSPADRKKLVHEYCALFAEVSKQYKEIPGVRIPGHSGHRFHGKPAVHST